MNFIEDILKVKGNQYYLVTPETPAYAAITLMAEKNIGALLVIKNNKIVGIFSERDYVRKIVEKGKSFEIKNVSDFMSTSVTTVSPKNSAKECMQLMTSKHIRHLPVVEGDQILGVVSIGDIVNKIIKDQTNIIEQLEKYITGG